MNQIVSPSMTDNQVNKLVEIFRAYAQKHKAGFTSKDVQVTLESKGLASAMFAPFQSLVEANSEMFSRTVKVNRSLTALQAFKSITSHIQHLDEIVVAEMPLGTDEEVTLCFFAIKKQMTCAEIAAALESRGLKPDPIAQATYNNANREFSDNYPNGTQWQNQAGKFCFAIWNDWSSRREVGVFQSDNDWNFRSFACGVSK